MNYALRITYPADQLRGWFGRVAMVCEKAIFYEHSDNVSRVHVHGILWRCTASIDTVKNWVKEALHLTPIANEWSFKQHYGKGNNKSHIDDGYIAYMSKGRYDPVYNHGYSQDVIAEQKAKGYDGKDDYKLPPDVIWYNNFEAWMLSEDHAPFNEEVVHDFDWLKRWSFSYNITKYKVFNVQCGMRHKMCVMTYAWNHGISIPSKETKFTF